MATQQQQTGTVPVLQGGLYGGAAFVVGYLLTFGLLVTQDALPTENRIQFVGQIFFNAQFVGTEAGGAATRNILVGYVQSGVIGFPALLLTALLGTLLLAAGYGVARGVKVPGTTTDDGTAYGASVVIGYLPLTFLGAVLFEVSVSSMGGFGIVQSDVTVSPDIFAAVVLAGIVFPALLGALGGYLAVRNGQTQPSE